MKIILLLVLFYIPFVSADIKGKNDCLTAEFNEVSVKDALSMYSEFTKRNIIIDASVEGALSLRLNCVTSDNLLDAILKIFDLNVSQQNNSFIVSSTSHFKQFHSVNTLIKLNHLNAVSFSGVLQKIFKGSVVQGISSTNTLLIQSRFNQIQKIRAAIKSADVPRNQFMIKAKLVSIGSDFLDSQGTSLRVTDSKDSLVYDFFSTFAAGASSGGSIVLKQTADFYASLDFALEQQDAAIDLITEPNIFAFENEEASVTDGVQIPYQVKLDDGSFSTEFQNAALQLRVTPFLSENGFIHLRIYFSKNNAGIQTEQGLQIETREIITQARIKSGQTLAIGGINETTKSISHVGVPYLKDIPYLGFFFGSKSEHEQKSKIVLLITPVLLEQTNEVLQ